MLQDDTTVTIDDVQADHTITFVYKEDGGTEPKPNPDDGKCKCCTKVKVEVLTCINNKNLLSKLNQVLIDEDDSCYCSDK